MTRRPAPVVLLAGLLALYLLAPFVAGLLQVGRADWEGADWVGIARASLVSVASASVATMLVAVGGIPLGWVLARVEGRAVAVLVAARSAFAGIDPALEDVAASLGHRPGAVFVRVGLAIGRRTIVAGLLLAWLRAFGEFGATVMVAYHPYSLPVFTYVAFGGQGLPAMLPILAPTLAAAVAMMAVSVRAGRPDKGAAPPAEPLPLPWTPVPPIGRGPTLTLALRRHLDGFALAVDWQSDARRLAILGPSGSGKTLTLRLIAGLGPAEGSRVVFGARDLGALPAHARGIAYVPQGYGLLPFMTMADQVRFAVDADDAMASHWTARLGLAGLEDRKPRELSLGQQQRVALARALSRRSARLMLLDEPFSALDAPLRARLRRELLALQGELAVTTVLVTHDPAEAMLLADELLLLHGGRVLQAGPVAAVFARPANETAARLLGAEIIGSGSVCAADGIDVGGVVLRVSGPPLVAGIRVGWAVRPHQIRIGRDGEGGLPASILARQAVHDGQRLVSLRIGDVDLEMMTDPGCPPEGPCRVRIDPGAVQVWPTEASSHDVGAVAAGDVERGAGHHAGFVRREP